MSAWVRSLIEHSPKMLLAGHDLADASGWQQAFQRFWQLYRHTNGEHCLFQDQYDTRFCIPYFLHGDEGRGYCRRPFMVESWQPCIGPKGLSFTNESGYLDHVFNNIFSGRYLMFKIHRCVVSFAKPASKSEAQPDHKVLADLYLFLFLRWGEHPRRPAWSDGCRCNIPVRKRNHSPSEEWFVTNFYYLAPAFSRVIMGMLDPQPDPKKTVHPVCFIACLHPRLVQSTCGSYAWERKEIGYSCAKMLVESSITLLLIHVNPTSYTLFPMTINTISKWGINWSVILFWMLPSGNLRHFTSIAGSIVFRNAISVMVSTGRTCHWKPHGGTRWDWGEAHPLFGAKKGASPCSKYQAWGKMRYCPIRAMFFT